jgi:hypothetical protein
VPDALRAERRAAARGGRPALPRPQARGHAAVQRAAAGGAVRQRLGRRRSQLVQGRQRSHHQQLAVVDPVVLVVHARAGRHRLRGGRAGGGRDGRRGARDPGGRPDARGRLGLWRRLSAPSSPE